MTAATAQKLPTPEAKDNRPLELMTLEQLAQRAGITVDEVKGRLWASYVDVTKPGDVDGIDDNGNPLICWNRAGEWMTEEMITPNAIAEKYQIDRRTVKKRIANAILQHKMCRPYTETQGARTYDKHWLSEADEVFGK